MSRRITLLQVVLGMIFMGAGGAKLAASDRMVDDFARLRLPQWLRVVTGALETGGGAGMLLGLAQPRLVPPAGLALGSVMIGAIATHVHRGDPTQKRRPPMVLLTITTVVVAAQGRRFTRP